MLTGGAMLNSIFDMYNSDTSVDLLLPRGYCGSAVILQRVLQIGQVHAALCNHSLQKD